MKISESALQSKLVAFLKEKKIYHVKIIMAGSAGHPDYLLCASGRFLAVECKSESGRQSPIQAYREKEIKESGGEYVLLTPGTFDEFKKRF